MRRWGFLLALTLAAGTACGGHRHGDTMPAPAPGLVTPASIDSLWAQAQYAVRHGHWSDASRQLDRLLLELSPDDPRVPQARYFLGEAHLARDEHLDAARSFRKVVDEFPDAPIAPDALLRTGDAYAAMWRRPELDPTYGETALTTYQELLSRYPNTPAAARAEVKIADLNGRFAYKAYKAASYYVRLKAYDSAILYLKDLVATYPRTSVTPDALLTLVRLYHKLGYQEDVKETCDYIRRYHPGTPGVDQLCPPPTPDTTLAPVPAPEPTPAPATPPAPAPAP
jgi:outer membrane protein assembly factor BamD